MILRVELFSGNRGYTESGRHNAQTREVCSRHFGKGRYDKVQDVPLLH
jgi:hypothetical protein